jgi:hypothetical protein
MVHIIRRIAKQGHYVPPHSHSPRGPFPPELFRQAPIRYPDEPAYEDGEELYLCRACGEHLYESELDEHAELCKLGDE